MQVVIIGGDAAGLKTAARLRRLDADTEIVVLEKGDVISYAACGLPYVLSGDIDSIDALLTTSWDERKDPGYFKRAKDIDVRIKTEAVGVDRLKKTVTAKNVDSGETTEIPYDKIVIATGANPVQPPGVTGCDLEGVGCFTRPDEMKQLKIGLAQGEIGRVVILGAGYIGLELCEAFAALWGAEVVLLEKEAQVLPRFLDPEMARLVRTELENNDIEVHCGVTVASIEETDDGLLVKDSDGGEYRGDRVVLAAGVRPNAALATSCDLPLGPHGGIRVDCRGRTVDSHIYAAGDCAELPLEDGSYLLPLGSIANRMGRVVANSIMGQDDELPRLHGSGVVKVFDLNVASTGLCSHRIKAQGGEPEAYWATFDEKAHYYPEAETVKMKVTCHAGGKLAGIQVIGKGEVVRWVNLFAQVLDLGDGDARLLNRIEHAYAPPYAAAMDPLHYFASMIERGPDWQLPPDSLHNGGDENWTVVSILSDNEEAEVDKPELKGRRLHIPYSHLRERLSELPKDNVVLLCALGTRSYDACVTLRNRGCHAKYVAGGVAFWM